MDSKEVNCEIKDSVSENGKLSENTADELANASNHTHIDESMDESVDSRSIVAESSSLLTEITAVENKENLDKTEADSCLPSETQCQSRGVEVSVEKAPQEESVVSSIEMTVEENMQNVSKTETDSLILEQECRSSGDGISTKITLQEEPVTSLSVIALAYDNSDSESEQTSESPSVEKNSNEPSDQMEIQITKEYRTIHVTSDEESDSDDSSSDSSSSQVSSSDAESDESDCVKKNSKKSSDTEQSNEKNNGRRRQVHVEKESKGEFDDLPPIEDLKISVPEVLCDPLGEVAWMVEQMVVVHPKPGKPTLNLDTILFVERGRRVLGRIFDVFGQVSDPHYCVRFNSTEHIKESDIKVGMTVYFCPNTEYTSVVFVQDLLKMKATDELGDDEHPEFSDDEEERAYYAALKQKQKGEKAKSAEEVPQKRQRTGQDPGWKSNHPWSSGRKQEQSRKPEKNYNAPGWTGGGAQQNVRHPGTSWQQHCHPAYTVAYPGCQNPHQAWPSACPPNHNSYNYPPGNPRPSFRPPPPRHFHSGPGIPRMQNSISGPYSQQSNSRTFGSPAGDPVNFPWQPRQPCAPLWRFSSPPPPPPPPPPPGM